MTVSPKRPHTTTRAHQSFSLVQSSSPLARRRIPGLWSSSRMRAAAAEEEKLHARAASDDGPRRRRCRTGWGEKGEERNKKERWRESSSRLRRSWILPVGWGGRGRKKKRGDKERERKRAASRDDQQLPAWMCSAESAIGADSPSGWQVVAPRRWRLSARRRCHSVVTIVRRLDVAAPTQRTRHHADGRLSRSFGRRTATLASRSRVRAPARPAGGPTPRDRLCRRRRIDPQRSANGAASGAAKAGLTLRPRKALSRRSCRAARGWCAAADGGACARVCGAWKHNCCLHGGSGRIGAGRASAVSGLQRRGRPRPSQPSPGPALSAREKGGPAQPSAWRAYSPRTGRTHSARLAQLSSSGCGSG